MISGIFSLFELLLDELLLLLLAFEDLLVLRVQLTRQVLLDLPFLLLLLRLDLGFLLQPLSLDVEEALPLFLLGQQLLLVLLGLERFFALSRLDEHVLLSLLDLLQIFPDLLFFKILDPLLFRHARLLTLSKAVALGPVDFLHGLLQDAQVVLVLVRILLKDLFVCIFPLLEDSLEILVGALAPRLLNQILDLGSFGPQNLHLLVVPVDDFRFRVLQLIELLLLIRQLGLILFA